MASKQFLLFSILFYISIANYEVSALKCYACTVSLSDIDQRCVTNPGGVQSGQKIVNCNFEYCTSKRVEYKDPPNKVHSMHRGCEQDPDQMNTILEDDNFITYYKACRKDLCNGGSGKGGDNAIGFDPETGEEGILLVKGNNNASGKRISVGVVLGAAVAAVVVGIIGYKKYRNIIQTKEREDYEKEKLITVTIESEWDKDKQQ